MDFNQNTPLVFHWKNEDLDKVLKFAPLVGVTLLGIIPLIIWLSFPNETLRQIDWSEMGRKMLSKPNFLVGMLIQVCACIAAYMLLSKHQRNARLTLNDTTLSYSSGLPLSRWFDWHLDLEDIRSKKIKLRFSGNELGAQPVLLYRLSWGISGLRQIRPAAWILPNQTTLPVQKPSSFFGLVNWKGRKIWPCCSSNLINSH